MSRMYNQTANVRFVQCFNAFVVLIIIPHFAFQGCWIAEMFTNALGVMNRVVLELFLPLVNTNKDYFTCSEKRTFRHIYTTESTL